MKKLFFVLTIFIVLLAGCRQNEKAIPFELDKVNGDFLYGEIYKISKKDTESTILRVNNDTLLFGVQDEHSRTIAFHWLGLDQKTQKTKSVTISEKVGSKDDNLYLGVEGNTEFDVRNERNSDTVGIFNFSGEYFDLFSNDFSDYQQRSVELSSGKQLIGLEPRNSKTGKSVLVKWGKDGKIENEISVEDVLEDSQASCDSMTDFGEFIYIFSKETKTIYQLTEELKVVKKYDLNSYLPIENPDEWNDGEFVYQAELNKNIFSIGKKNGEVYYFDVTEEGVSPWDFTNPKYQGKYIINGLNLIDMGNKDVYRIDSKKSYSLGGRGITSNGDFYFQGTRDLANDKPKDENIEYLIKINKDQVKDFLVEYGEKVN
ncbi:hypothetical protein ARX50_10615 [Listeria monocytogenes]|nr:hypothetical protein [Listeria monocytogenes]